MYRHRVAGSGVSAELNNANNVGSNISSSMNNANNMMMNNVMMNNASSSHSVVVDGGIASAENLLELGSHAQLDGGAYAGPNFWSMPSVVANQPPQGMLSQLSNSR